MYHAKDRHLNNPRTELRGKRGGTDNSLTRITMKPTHLIGGYAQLSFGFNYYGPTGSQRDEITIVRKRRRNWSSDAGQAQVAMVMNLDKCIGCHTCSVTCKQVWTNRPGTEYVWFNNVETKPGLGYPQTLRGPGALAGRLDARPQGPAAAEGRRTAQEAADDLLEPRPAARSTTTTSLDVRLRDADRRAAEDTTRSRARTRS